MEAQGGTLTRESCMLGIHVLQPLSGCGCCPCCWTFVFMSSSCGCFCPRAGPTGATWPLLGAALGQLGWRRSHSRVRMDRSRMGRHLVTLSLAPASLGSGTGLIRDLTRSLAGPSLLLGTAPGFRKCFGVGGANGASEDAEASSFVIVALAAVGSSSGFSFCHCSSPCGPGPVLSPLSGTDKGSRGQVSTALQLSET